MKYFFSDKMLNKVLKKCERYYLFTLLPVGNTKKLNYSQDINKN